MPFLNSKKIVKHISILVLFLVFLLPQISSADTNFSPDKYPRLANYFLKWNMSDADAKEVAKWDLAVLDPQPEIFNPNAIKIIRETNPKIKLIAYISAAEIPSAAKDYSPENIWRQMYDLVDENNWWLRDQAGNHVSFWPGNWLVNVSEETKSDVMGKRWSSVLPELINQKLMGKNNWDGIFFDNTWEDITWINNSNIDINNDGQNDSSVFINSRWQDGMNKLFSQARNLFGSGKIMLANGSDFYNQYLNGRMYENFPSVAGGWPGVLSLYTKKNTGYEPFGSIINANAGNTDGQNNWQRFRFGLASTLLGDGLYSFDRGDETHHELWWYDEYNTFLGQPVAPIKNLLNGSDKINTGVWQRDFTNGIAIVNSTGQNQSVELNGEYEKIHGTEDTKTNDGSIVTSVDLQANDGLILLRPIEKIIGQAYTNASFVRVFDSLGQSIRNGFFAYDSSFRGNATILSTDIDHDGQTENIVAEGKKITIYDSNNKPRYSFLPYGGNYSGNINFALGDLDNNGFNEIVTGAAKGGPHIRIFNHQGKLINPGFFAFDKKSKGGVTVAIGDINGDGRKEIIAGAGTNALPQIKTFTAQGKLLNTFLAYEKGFKGGVNVAAGDIDGKGKDEIITSKGPGGEPLVKIFSGQGKTLNFGFYVFDRTSRGGARVIAYDLDGNGRAEILANRTNVFTTAIINNQ